jgi:outer membrane protein assembly factor BamB
MWSWAGIRWLAGGTGDSFYAAFGSSVLAFTGDGTAVWDLPVYRPGDFSGHEVQLIAVSSTGELFGHLFWSEGEGYGTRLWAMYASGGLAQFPPNAGDYGLSEPALLPGRALVTLQNGVYVDNSPFTLVSTDASGNGFRWMPDAQDVGTPAPYALTWRRWMSAPILDADGNALVVSAAYDAQGGAAPDKLFAIHPEDGMVAWQLTLPDATPLGGIGTAEMLAGADGAVYLGRHDEFLVLCNRQVAVRWMVPLLPLFLRPDGALYLLDSAGMSSIRVVQATSPGLAPSAWPVKGHDNRRSYDARP